MVADLLMRDPEEGNGTFIERRAPVWRHVWGGWTTTSPPTTLATVKRGELMQAGQESVLLQDILRLAVKRHPEKTALIDGEIRRTYGEVNERIHRLASGLLSLGLSPGEHIAILAANSHRYWETYFVADIAGMPLVPLNIRLAAHELAFILRDAEVKALLIGPEFLELYDQFKAETPDLRHTILLGGESAAGMLDYESLIANSNPLTESARQWGEDAMINLCYTGGSTGLPKGVMLTQRNIVSHAANAVQTIGFTESDVWMHAAPMFHLADAWACYAVTSVGGTHVFIDRFTPQAALEGIQQHRVTKTVLVPTMINTLVNFTDVADYDTSSIDHLLFGAAPMSVDRLKAAVEIFGPVLFQVYGMTETSPILTAMRPDFVRYDGSPRDTARLASCGRAIAGVTVRVVDEKTGKDVRPGEVGEIIAKGANVMAGYWKREEETASALRDGYMHTGDLATVDEDGFIFIVDRAKDMIITGGENVYCAEVENALYSHDSVLEATVIGVPDERWGEAVLAVIVPKDGAEISEDAIIAHCRKLIAGYKVPKRVIFQSDPLPKSGPGKILKRELRKPYWAGKDKGVN
jgi:long-chain acyl-CoA synthetase